MVQYFKIDPPEVFQAGVVLEYRFFEPGERDISRGKYIQEEHIFCCGDETIENSSGGEKTKERF